jgi:hypothetical protein
MKQIEQKQSLLSKNMKPGLKQIYKFIHLAERLKSFNKMKKLQIAIIFLMFASSASAFSSLMIEKILAHRINK